MTFYSVSLFCNLFMWTRRPYILMGVTLVEKGARGSALPYQHPPDPDAFPAGAQHSWDQNLKPVTQALRFDCRRHICGTSLLQWTASCHALYELQLLPLPAVTLMSMNLEAQVQGLASQKEKSLLPICLYTPSSGHFMMCYVLHSICFHFRNESTIKCGLSSR